MANYERLTPLAVEEGGLRGGYRRVQPGDCVVAFSRKSIFTIKEVDYSTASPINLGLAEGCVALLIALGPYLAEKLFHLRLLWFRRRDCCYVQNFRCDQ